ncbi:MAG: hypothetical protein ACTHK2_09100 [Dokdonella sp.]|uniref:hypothetical protein n=1 Tax=Dokdonella sp. TaxID=2291710 RepID=UPI003F8075DB
MDEGFDPRTQVKLALNGTFTAHELEEIIARLMQARAALEPVVSEEPPEASSDREVLALEEPALRFRSRIGGALRIWIRNEGFGWICAELSARTVLGIREFLGKEPGHSLQAH